MTGWAGGPWPALEAGYEDEFGAIDSRVYETAGRLWPLAERLGERALGDSQLAQTLLFRASAAVTAAHAHDEGAVHNLPGYLLTTFRRLVLAEATRNGHRRELERTTVSMAAADPVAVLDRGILLRELQARMDPWTRHVAALLLDGRSFREIAVELGADPSWVRRRFALRMARLLKTRTSSRAGSPVRAATRGPCRTCHCRSSDPAR
jgi:hypothetical protein